MEWRHVQEMGATENGDCCSNGAEETFACSAFSHGEIGAAFIKAKAHMNESRGVGCGSQKDGQFHESHVSIVERKIVGNKSQWCVFPFGRGSPGIWDAGEMAPFRDCLSALAGATASEDAKTRPVKDR